MCRRSTYDEMILPRKSGRWRSRRSAYQFVWKYPEQAGLMQYSLRFHRKSENGWRQNHIMVESITTIAAPGAESGGGVPIAIFEMLQGLRRVGAESAWGANPGSTDCAGSPLRERSTFARDDGSLWVTICGQKFMRLARKDENPCGKFASNWRLGVHEG